MDLIPQQASLLIQNDIYPLYSDLNDAYALPPLSNSAEEILSYLKSNSNDVEFVLVNWNVDITNAERILTRSNLHRNFGLYAWADGVVVLKRYYGGLPLAL